MNNVGLRVVFSILSVKLNDSSLLIINFFLPYMILFLRDKRLFGIKISTLLIVLVNKSKKFVS